MPKAPAQSVQGLEHGIRCLLHLASAEAPVGCRELARALGFEPTKVSRLLGTLAHLGLAAQTPDKKYVAGSGLNVLAALSLRGSRLLRAALPRVDALAAALGRGVALGVLWETRVCYLYHGAAGQGGTLATIGGHELYPAEKSAIGLAVLAQAPAGEAAALFPGLPQLPKELTAARKRGYALGATGSVGVCIGGEARLGGLAVDSCAAGDAPAVAAALRDCAEGIFAAWAAA